MVNICFSFLADRPDPLRLPEVIIVICVLLLWIGSIIIFIRHSELLRIRHRDLPYRSIKPPINLNHINIVSQTNDTILHSKSGVSANSGLGSPLDNYTMNEYRHGEFSATVSSETSPRSRNYRHTRSFDMNTSPTKYSLDKHNDKEQLLSPHRLSTEVKHHLLDIHRKSVDNVYRKSMENLESIKYSTCYSTNDISKRKPDESRRLITKKRCVQESPV